MDIFDRIFVKTITAITALFLLIACYGSICTINSEASFLISTINHPQYLSVIGMILLSGLVFSVFKKINVLPEKNIRYYVILFAVILLTIQIAFLLVYDVQQITDSYIIRDQALAIAKGIDSHVDYESTSYFVRYGNNSFIVWVSVIFYKLLIFLGVRNDARAFAILNIILIDIGILFLYKIAQLVKNTKFAAKVFFLSVLNPLTYLVIYWSYSCTYSLPLTVGIIYFSLILWKKKPGLILGGGIMCSNRIHGCSGLSLKTNSTYSIYRNYYLSLYC